MQVWSSKLRPHLKAFTSKEGGKNLSISERDAELTGLVNTAIASPFSMPALQRNNFFLKQALSHMHTVHGDGESDEGMDSPVIHASLPIAWLFLASEEEADGAPLRQPVGLAEGRSLLEAFEALLQVCGCPIVHTCMHVCLNICV